MPIKRFLLAGTALTALSFAAAPALAQDFYNEYGEYYGAFDDWDIDDNAFVDENEFYDYTFSLADENDDALLDENEWSSYTSYWYEPYNLDYGAFGNYDTDRSGYLEDTEYYAMGEDVGYYAIWDNDRDGYVNPDEYAGITDYYGAYGYD